MKYPTKFKLECAKRTMFGRAVCRLFGDQTGQAMMEYVVIGVLVVAAAVAMVLVFGDQIRDNFHAMILALQGKKDTLQQHVEDTGATNEGAANDAEEQGEATAGGE